MWSSIEIGIQQIIGQKVVHVKIDVVPRGGFFTSFSKAGNVEGDVGEELGEEVKVKVARILPDLWLIKVNDFLGGFGGVRAIRGGSAKEVMNCVGELSQGVIGRFDRWDRVISGVGIKKSVANC